MCLRLSHAENTRLRWPPHAVETHVRSNALPVDSACCERVFSLARPTRLPKRRLPDGVHHPLEYNFGRGLCDPRTPTTRIRANVMLTRLETDPDRLALLRTICDPYILPRPRYRNIERFQLPFELIKCDGRKDVPTSLHTPVWWFSSKDGAGMPQPSIAFRTTRHCEKSTNESWKKLYRSTCDILLQ